MVGKLVVKNFQKIIQSGHTSKVCLELSVTRFREKSPIWLDVGNFWPF